MVVVEAFIFERAQGAWFARRLLPSSSPSHDDISDDELMHRDPGELRTTCLMSLGSDVIRCGPLQFSMISPKSAFFVVSLSL